MEHNKAANKPMQVIHLRMKNHGTTTHPATQNQYERYSQKNIKSPLVSTRRHDIHHQLHDPFAKPSNVRLSRKSDGTNKIIGDGDVWVEILCEHTKTGEVKSFFKSTKDPHRKVPDEPPTGASHVIYLKTSYLEKKYPNCLK